MNCLMIIIIQYILLNNIVYMIIILYILLICYIIIILKCFLPLRKIIRILYLYSIMWYIIINN